MNSPRLVLLSGALLAYLGAWGQADPVHSQIAALTSDAQVQALVRPFGWEFEELLLGDSVRAVYQPYARTPFRWRGASWYRADLDGNGWADLLVVGRRRDIPFVFCVLDSGSNRLRVVRNFYDAGDQRQPTARVVHKRGQALLAYSAFTRRLGKAGKLTGCKTQLLTYRGGGFVPYERHPAAHRITTISYISRLYYHGQHETRVRIDSSGYARLLYRTAASSDTVFTTTQGQQQLSAAKFAEVQDLLNYVRFTSCSPTYTAHSNHRPLITLRVTYEGGEKVIKDASGGGTLGLYQVYNWLESLAEPLQAPK